MSKEIAYVGAPWRTFMHAAKSRVGNGGFSLRRREAMQDCCIHDTPPIAEDMYLTACLIDGKLQR